MTAPLPMRVQGRLRRFFAVMVLAVAVQLPAAQSQSVALADLAARYALAFTYYVAWPNAALPESAPLRVGVLPSDPVGAALTRELAGRTFEGHRIVIVASNDVERLSQCQMLVFTTAAPGLLDALLLRARGTPVLMVAFQDGFAERGGTIELVRVNQGLRFDVNRDSLRQAGIEVRRAGLFEKARRVLSSGNGSASSPPEAK